jgi:hypothetical protein
MFGRSARVHLVENATASDAMKDVCGGICAFDLRHIGTGAPETQARVNLFSMPCFGPTGPGAIRIPYIRCLAFDNGYKGRNFAS